jgi:hypothetical protein
MIPQILCSLRTCFFLAAFLFCAAMAPAQEPQPELEPPPLPDFATAARPDPESLEPPPLPDFATAPPPDPESLESPPSLDWEPLEESPPVDEPGAALLPEALFVPPPESGRLLPLPPEPPPAAFRSEPASDAEIDQVTPRIEVWRAESDLPQKPKAAVQGTRFLAEACLTGNDPVTVRLWFHPLSEGKAVSVRAARGIALDTPDDVLRIPMDGQCVVSVTLDPEMTQSHLSFTCEGLITTLVLQRTSSKIVEQLESAASEDAL